MARRRLKMREEPYDGGATDFYVAPDGVAEIVNLAIELRRPLLVEGEPGCGKTMLAESIAEEKGVRTNFVKIVVKSTSKARDLLYRMDSLRRLQDAQSRPRGGASDLRIFPYLSLGPLGQAIQRDEHGVVLLDEIDKADIDFPNDLLDVLDDFSFQVEDLPPGEEIACRKEKGFGRTVRAAPENRPLVVITSNREKRLPEPFLRRCLFVHIPFPESETVLADIVRKNLKVSTEDLADGLLEAAARAFREIRQRAVRADVRKPPTTSELIDWVRILHWRGMVEELKEEDPLPPYWQTLFKSKVDLDQYQRVTESE